MNKTIEAAGYIHWDCWALGEHNWQGFTGGAQCSVCYASVSSADFECTSPIYVAEIPDGEDPNDWIPVEYKAYWCPKCGYNGDLAFKNNKCTKCGYKK